MRKNGEEFEGEFESRVRMEQRQRSSRSVRTSSIAFRAPQENFTLDDFDLEKVYGFGSYSKVIMAKKKDTGHVYALKIMDKKFITKENKAARVKLERIVLDQLDHPGVTKLFFTFQDNYSLYMALESCEGGDLFDQINRKGRLSEDEARFYAAELIDALEYIHGLGLIHQDIKPENLLLSADGHIKIADFGSVTPTSGSRISALPEATKAKADDKTCAFVGTAAYVSPEALNSAPATFGNDLWALGCTLYQMLSGTSPFKDATDWLIFQKIVTRDINFPDYFSDEASDLIDKLLDKDPQKRLGVGLDGYAALKFHPFFKGIEWENIWTSTPPELAQESHANCDCAQDNRWIHQQSVREGNRNSGTASSVSSNLSSVGSFDSKWQGFLDYGESIIMISAVKKLNKLTTKKVQLILTDRPKLVCTENNKLDKMKVLWSDDPKELTVQVTNAKHFKICTPGKVRSFEDPKERAWQWKKSVEGLINRA